VISLLAIMLACIEPDGGTCAQQVNVGPFNVSMPTVEGGMGQYTSYLWQSPTSPGTACLHLTKYIAVCSCFADSPYNVSGTGNGGSLCLYNGNHRAIVWSDWQSLFPAADGDGELGRIGTTGTLHFWRRVSAYEYVAPPRSIVCPGGTGMCISDAAPRGSSIRFDCQNDLGCEWRPGSEYLDNVWHTVRDGAQVCVRNVSANPLFVLDTQDGGSPELDGDFVGGRWALLCIERVDERWIEKSRQFP
jgi:hypothetical protein